MLLTRATLLPIHPVHVPSVPITSHEGHPLLQHLQHGVQLFAAWSHRQRNLTSLLRHRGRESEILAIHAEPLRKREGLRAVDLVRWAWTEVRPVGLHLWLSPLVASPIWVAAIIVRARVVGDLLNLVVALVHVEFRATTQTFEALCIAIVIVILASLRHGHVHKIEVQIATARRSSRTEIHDNREGLAWEVGLVELAGIAVIRRGLVHQVETVRWPVLHGRMVVDRRGPWHVVGLHDAIFVDVELPLLRGIQNLGAVLPGGWEERFALQGEGLALWIKRGVVSAHLAELQHGNVLLC